jgi:molybdopterin synthase catalytic subunit
MTVEARLEPAALRPERELTEFIAGLSGEGAVVSFLGIARPRDREGSGVVVLHLDHYPGVTEQSLRAIAESAHGRFDVSAVWVVHRCGGIAPGEPIVFVAAAGLHRRAAFDAADYLMDRLKTEAVFWKREDTSEGPAWIEPTEADHAARARWSDACPE